MALPRTTFVQFRTEAVTSKAHSLLQMVAASLITSGILSVSLLSDIGCCSQSDSGACSGSSNDSLEDPIHQLLLRYRTDYCQLNVHSLPSILWSDRNITGRWHLLCHAQHCFLHLQLALCQWNLHFHYCEHFFHPSATIPTADRVVRRPMVSLLGILALKLSVICLAPPLCAA